jgi:hypothetical protein
MNGQDQRHALDRQIRAHEDQVAEDLSTIRVLEQEWDDYRQVMRENTARFEEASIAIGADNYFVQKQLAARKELDSYVGRLAYEQEEFLAETAQSIRSESEAELDRLRNERAGASWD